MYKEVILKSFDDYKLNIHLFDVDNPKAVIQFAHGMEEYQDRYESFFEQLQKNGFAVVSNDLRGHGKNAAIQGYFGKKDGWKSLIEDQNVMYEFIKKTYKGAPVYLFGHSMGTILLRLYLTETSDNYLKVVLSGYPNYQGAAGIGSKLCNIVRLFHNEMHRSKFLTRLAIGPYMKAVRDRKTDLDWLSYNEENVKNYINDPLCGKPFTIPAFKDLFIMVSKLHNIKAYKNVNKDLSFLMLSGKDDPVTGGEKGIKDTLSTLNKIGFTNITEISYEKMRHEILNETNKQLVINDIIKFLNE